ncbi:MAG: rRNA maturation RNase YbeY [Acidobacteria bacterium]|nr:rRNA maturation RNase YbeY [Acidobacteriota bacterium]
MTARLPRRGAQLAVALAAPDGAVAAARGLAAWLAGTAPARARGHVTVALVSDGRMKALNRTYRGQDYATDVLSFPTVESHADGDGPGTGGRRRSSSRTTGSTSASPLPSADGHGDGFLGDIVIAAGVATRQADEAGHSLQVEIRILALHGLLHLLGYDHETDAGEMSRVEARLRKKAGLGGGLIERVSGRPSAHARLRTRSKQ